MLRAALPILYTKPLPRNSLLIQAPKNYITHVCKLTLNRKQKPYLHFLLSMKKTKNKYKRKLSLQCFSQNSKDFKVDSGKILPRPLWIEFVWTGEQTVGENDQISPRPALPHTHVCVCTSSFLKFKFFHLSRGIYATPLNGGCHMLIFLTSKMQRIPKWMVKRESLSVSDRPHTFPCTTPLLLLGTTFHVYSEALKATVGLSPTSCGC